jgi:hypothetical protein
MDKDILNIIAFCILMENNNGIIEKSPDYVIKKFKRYCEGQNDSWIFGLDNASLKKLDEWAKKWLNRDIDKEMEIEYEHRRKQAEYEQRSNWDWEY